MKRTTASHRNVLIVVYLETGQSPHFCCFISGLHVYCDLLRIREKFVFTYLDITIDFLNLQELASSVLSCKLRIHTVYLGDPQGT